MSKGKAPFPWFGGKSQMTTHLLPLLPEHHLYVEPFGGGASLLFAKEPAPVEVYNDLDSGLVNFFRVIRDHERAVRLYWLISNTPYSREEFDHCRATWWKCEDSVDRAYRWFVVARMSFAGMFASAWGSTRYASARGMAARNSAWLSSHQLIAEAHQRLMRVQVEHADFRRILDRYDTPETLHYVDPPYVHATRTECYYEHELSDEDHAELVDRMTNLKGAAIVSGYDSDLYKPLKKAGWHRFEVDTFCRAAGSTVLTGGGDSRGQTRSRRTECVWASPRVKRAMDSSRKSKGTRAGRKAPKRSEPIHATPARRAVA